MKSLAILFSIVFLSSMTFAAEGAIHHYEGFVRSGYNLFSYRTKTESPRHPGYLVGFGGSVFFTDALGLSLDVDINHRSFEHSTNTEASQLYYDIGLGPTISTPLGAVRFQFTPSIFGATHYETYSMFGGDHRMGRQMPKFFIGVRALTEVLYEIKPWILAGISAWMKDGLMDGVKGGFEEAPGEKYFELGVGGSLHFAFGR